MSGPADVRMPRLSESMAEGTVVRWLHAAGARVGAGEEIAEIETDKAVVGLAADAAGVLEIVVPEGASARVGAVIARLGDGAPPPPTAPTAAPSPPAAAARRPVASPLARRRARELGVDLHGVRGTGPHGRIVRDDVVAAADGRAGRQQGGPGGPAVGPGGSGGPGEMPGGPDGMPDGPGGPDGMPGGPERVPHTRLRAATVRRLAEAAAVPVFTLDAEVDTTAATALRRDLAGLADPVPTLTDLVVSATARALREHPALNASAVDGAVLRHPRPHVGVAVDTGDGLVVPVVRDPGSPVAVAAATRALVERARAGAATPADLDGATVTVSNLGMLGVARFAAVIVPPQAAVLAVGAVRDLPRVRGGAVVAVPVLALTLTCDHRAVDGAPAARFLARLVELLERPLALMIERSAP